jgi:hypothetical protein
MTGIQHDRGNLWFRLKLFFALGKTDSQIAKVKAASKAKRRSRRTTAFFEMP